MTMRPSGTRPIQDHVLSVLTPAGLAVIADALRALDTHQDNPDAALDAAESRDPALPDRRGSRRPATTDAHLAAARMGGS